MGENSVIDSTKSAEATGKPVIASADAVVLKVGDQCTCHAWNRDMSMLAYCPNNDELRILRKDRVGWTDEYNLREHDQVITSMDWGWKENRIVTCSMDRNAYVWGYSEAEQRWKPTLVILRQNRACTHVRWSPQETSTENKFAVASGAKCVSVCYFEEEHDWWVSKVMKEDKTKAPLFNSTVTVLEWHPNNVLLATGSTDNKLRIINTAVKSVDKKRLPMVLGVEKPTFGKIVAEFASDGWIMGIGFSPSGRTLAWTGQDCSIYTVELGDLESPVSQDHVTVLRLPFSPLRDLVFLSEDILVAAGYDMVPMTFLRQKEGGWSFGGKLEAADSKAGPKKQSAVSSAFAKFENRSKLGTDARDTELNTPHQNCITPFLILPILLMECEVNYWNLMPAEKDDDQVIQFSSSGLDGVIHLWKQETIQETLKKLRI